MSEATEKEAMEITVADLPMEFRVSYIYIFHHILLCHCCWLHTEPT